jgi:hypothetical protein
MPFQAKHFSQVCLNNLNFVVGLPTQQSSNPILFAYQLRLQILRELRNKRTVLSLYNFFSGMAVVNSSGACSVWPLPVTSPVMSKFLFSIVCFLSLSCGSQSADGTCKTVVGSYKGVARTAAPCKESTSTANVEVLADGTVDASGVYLGFLTAKKEPCKYTISGCNLEATCSVLVQKSVPAQDSVEKFSFKIDSNKLTGSLKVSGPGASVYDCSEYTFEATR